MANKLIISHNTIVTPSGRLVATMNSVSLSNAVRREYQRYFVVAPEMADILRDIAQWHESVAGGDYICRHYWNDLSQRIADVLAEIDKAI